MAYEDFWDLPKRTVTDNVFCDKAFNVAKDPKYYRYQIRLTSMFYKFFDKKTLGDDVKSEIMSKK